MVKSNIHVKGNCKMSLGNVLVGLDTGFALLSVFVCLFLFRSIRGQNPSAAVRGLLWSETGQRDEL